MSSPTTRKKAASKGGKKGQSAKRQWTRAKAHEIEVPSGNTALVKRPGMEVFLLEGLLPDALMPMVQDAISSGKGLPQKKVDEMKSDMNALADMMDAMDRVTARIVVEPKVLWHKRPKVDGNGEPVTENYKVGDTIKERQVLETIPEDERIDQDGVFYTDDIDYEDKSFLFQYAVGGTADLERFRLESSEAVAPVSPEPDVEGSA